MTLRFLCVLILSILQSVRLQRAIKTRQLGSNMAEGGSSDLVKEDPDAFIISGVIDGVKQSFVDSGVDTEILAQLERLWVSKLRANASEGMSIADVLGAPEPVKKDRSGGKRASEPAMDTSSNEEMGEKEKPSDILVISSEGEELLPVPGPSVSLHLKLRR